MSFCFSFGCIESCTFKNYVYADLSPWKVSSICFFVDLDFFSINCDRIFACCNFISQSIFTL